MTAGSFEVFWHFFCQGLFCYISELVGSLFMKLFKTKSIDVVKACQSFTGSEFPSCVLKRKTDKFILRFNCVENTFCNFCSSLIVMLVLNTLFFFVFFLVKLV